MILPVERALLQSALAFARDFACRGEEAVWAETQDNRCETFNHLTAAIAYAARAHVGIKFHENPAANGAILIALLIGAWAVGFAMGR